MNTRTPEPCRPLNGNSSCGTLTDPTSYASAVKSGRGSPLAGREELGLEGTKALAAVDDLFGLTQELGELRIFERL